MAKKRTTDPHGGQRRGAGRPRKQLATVKDKTDYAGLAKSLMDDSPIESSAAKTVAVAGLIESMRQLYRLRMRSEQGTITVEESRIVPPLVSALRRQLDYLKLDKTVEMLEEL